MINTTRSHLFWNQSIRRWTKADALKYGAHLRTPSSGTATVVGGYTPRVTTGWMWDLTIPTDHDFYIQTATTTILVHNCGDDGEQLPLFDDSSYRVDNKTRGVLELDGESIPLASKEDSLPNYGSSGHVEGQAALIMRERGATSGILQIDNPNGICPRCVAELPTLLPEGAVLDVRTPPDAVPVGPRWSLGRMFIGNARDPNAWPR